MHDKQCLYAVCANTRSKGEGRAAVAQRATRLQLPKRAAGDEVQQSSGRIESMQALRGVADMQTDDGVPAGPSRSHPRP